LLPEFIEFVLVYCARVCGKAYYLTNILNNLNLIMRDSTHIEHIERWAKFVKSHPRSIWIREVRPLIDAQIIMANTFYERLTKVEGGIEKIRKLRNLKK